MVMTISQYCPLLPQWQTSLSAVAKTLSVIIWRYWQVHHTPQPAQHLSILTAYAVPLSAGVPNNAVGALDAADTD